jgi:hypothetical protein
VGLPWTARNRQGQCRSCHHNNGADDGPGFIKICSYAPYPVKIWLSGYEAVRRMAGAAGLDVQMLGDGFGACDDPPGLLRDPLSRGG